MESHYRLADKANTFTSDEKFKSIDEALEYAKDHKGYSIIIKFTYSTEYIDNAFICATSTIVKVMDL